MSGTGVDILDGHKSRFAFATCGRSNATFADAEGAFVANIDGPVRAIRSYVGANSGPLTQRTEIFYDFRYDQITDLRVHAIPGIMSFYDWSTAATGMQYRNSLMTTPVVVDGSPDTVPAGVPSWEYLDGAQGSLSTTYRVDTSIAPMPDDVGRLRRRPHAPVRGVLGRGRLLRRVGRSQFTSAIANTDPRTSPFATFTAHQSTAFWPETIDPGRVDTGLGCRRAPAARRDDHSVLRPPVQRPRARHSLDHPLDVEWHQRGGQARCGPPDWRS